MDLMGLVHKELILPISTTLRGEDAFRFRHLLIRDAAYEHGREVAARRTARAVRGLAGARGRGSRERRGGDRRVPPRAGLRLPQGAGARRRPVRRARSPCGASTSGRGTTCGRARRPAGRGAAALRAASVGPDLGAERAWTLYHLGAALREAGDEPAALAALDEAVRLAEGADDRSLGWRARIARTDALTEVDPRSVPTATARAEIEAAIEALTELGDEAGLADAWTKLGFIEFMPCRFDRAAHALTRAVAYARACGDERLLFEALRLQMVSES